MGLCNEKFVTANLDRNHFQTILSLIKYDDIPLVTIEQAIQPLISFLPQIQIYLQLIQNQCRQYSTSDLLTFDQQASIMLYTIIWQPYDQCLYFQLSRILQNIDFDQIQSWTFYLKLLFSSLIQIPSNYSIVYRASHINLSKQYQPHEIICWNDLFLCTSSIECIREYENLQTIFLIECQTIKNLQLYCYDKRKNLFVFLPGTKFQVIDCFYDKTDKYYLIKLKEIQSSYLLHSNKEKSLNLFQRYAVFFLCLLIKFSIRMNYRFSLFFKTSEGHVCDRYRNSSLEHRIINSEHSWTIDLDQQNLTDRDMKIVIKYALNKRNCKRIRLRENFITAHGCSILSEGLYNNQNLESLDLRKNQISDMGVQFLSLAIVYSNLKTLNLESNEITAEGAVYLAQILKNSRTLAELYLSKNHLGNRGTEILANALSTEQSSLQHLYLGQNEITDEGVKYLSEMLKNNRILTWLWLTENEIGNDGIEYLCNSLADSNITLEWLFVNSNRLITDSCIDDLIHMLKRNSTLKTLYLNNCNLSEITKRKLLQIIKTKKDFDLEV